MVQPDIDLQRDCELWCDFDIDYFDSQRNKIRDRSGNGRNPAASGGPTLGANGPDSFEAASFDGSDDSFETPTISHDVSELTVHTIVTPEVESKSSGIIYAATSEFDFSLRYRDNNEFRADVTANIPGGGTDFQSINFSASPRESIRITHIFDNGIQKMFVNGELVGQNNLAGPTIAPKNSSARIFIIGSNGSGKVFTGSITMVAEWSRVLNASEIEYLNRLTEPRRAQL
jgi:hypothetical protein